MKKRLAAWLSGALILTGLSLRADEANLPAMTACSGHGETRAGDVGIGDPIAVSVKLKAGNRPWEQVKEGAPQLAETRYVCVGEDVQFEVVASDKDDHVCLSVTTAFDNYIRRTPLQINVSSDNPTKYAGATFDLGTQELDKMMIRTWQNTWRVPAAAAGRLLTFRLSGQVEDWGCDAYDESPKGRVRRDHRNSKDPPRDMGLFAVELIVPVVRKIVATQGESVRADSVSNPSQAQTGYATAGSITLNAYSDEAGTEQNFPDSQPVWTIESFSPVGGSASGTAQYPLVIGHGKTIEYAFEEPGVYQIEARTCVPGKTMYLTVVQIKLDAMPKVLSANSHGDVPIHFKILGMDKAEIVRTKPIVVVNGRALEVDETLGNQRLRAGDWVRGNGSNALNGQANSYTVFVARSSFSGEDLSGSGNYRAQSASVEMSVKFSHPDNSDNVLECRTGRVDLQGFLDRNIDVCHVGKTYMSGSDYPALDPNANPVSKSADRKAVPYTRQMTDRFGAPLYRWATHRENQAVWRLHNNQIENVYWNHIWSVFWRARNVTWRPADFNMTVRVDTAWIPFAQPRRLFSTRGTQWMELLANEERAVVFVWYYGIKTVRDLSNADRQVLDVRLNEARTTQIKLFPDAKVFLGVDEVRGEEEWKARDSVNNYMGIAGGVVAVVSAGGPVGWAVAGLGYATILLSAEQELQNIIGGRRNPGGGLLGGEATAFGVITKNKSSGEPMPGTWYGDPGQGLGGPNMSQFTNNRNGELPQSGSVVYNTPGGMALQTWKVFSSYTTSAWAEDSWWGGRGSQAWIRFRYGNDPDAKKATVFTVSRQNIPDEEIVGEEIQ